MWNSWNCVICGICGIYGICGILSKTSVLKTLFLKTLVFQTLLLRKNNFAVDDIGYFLNYEVDQKQKEFRNKIKFKKNLIEYEGYTYWIEPVLADIKSILANNTPPEASPNCEYCNYSKKTSKIFNYASSK